VFCNKHIKVRASDLLFPLNKQLQIYRQGPFDLEECFDAFKMNVHLSLIIGGTPGIQSVIAHRGFERRGSPEFERLDRLHIVMSIDQHRRLSRGTEPFSIDDRMSCGGKLLDVLQADHAHVF